MHQTEESKPRILSEEEIELYLRGDRREIDRLILLSINRIDIGRGFEAGISVVFLAIVIDRPFVW